MKRTVRTQWGGKSRQYGTYVIFLKSMAYCYNNNFYNLFVFRQQIIAMVCTTFSYHHIHYPSHPLPLGFTFSLLLLIMVKY